MAEVSNSLRQKLEHLFEMSGGYVLDFSNASFGDFVRTSLGFNPYDRYDGSKASILRQMWHDLDAEAFSTLTLEMLDYWRTNKSIGGKTIAPGEQTLFDEATAAVTKAIATAEPTDTAFLLKDFGVVDLSQIEVPLSYQEVIQQRLDEIERCLNAEAPLAVVFLCGSTLEGLLSHVASKNPAAFNQARSAPKDQTGAVKSLAAWTLADLISVSRELGVVGEDVAKHAHAVRDFRNYIHPRQQLKENFTPRMFTAQMAHQVLLAALSDLSTLHGAGSTA